MGNRVPTTTLKTRLRKRRNKRAERVLTYALWDRLIPLVRANGEETTEKLLKNACTLISTLASHVTLLESLDRERQALLNRLEDKIQLSF